MLHTPASCQPSTRTCHAADAARQVLSPQRLHILDLKALDVQVIQPQQRNGVLRRWSDRQAGRVRGSQAELMALRHGRHETQSGAGYGMATQAELLRCPPHYAPAPRTPG